MGETELKFPGYIKKQGNFYLNTKTDRFLTNYEIKIYSGITRKNPETRSIEYLKLLCKDLTIAEIAKQMNLSPRTVEHYRDNLLRETGSKSKVGLVIYAIKNKIVDI